MSRKFCQFTLFLLFSAVLAGCKIQTEKVSKTTVDEPTKQKVSNPSKSGFTLPFDESQNIKVRLEGPTYSGDNFEELTKSPKYSPYFRSPETNDGESFQVELLDASRLRDLLPKSSVQLGETWEIPGGVTEYLLGIFHQPTITDLNIDGSGAVGVLSNFSSEYYQVDFRLHAQFLYGDYIYVTPAQVRGSFLLERDSGEVKSFKLGVPKTHYYNVAYEMHGGDASTGLGEMDLKLTQDKEQKEEVWIDQLSEEQIDQALSTELYSFTHIHWLTVPEAVEEARETKKPILAIVLEGVLDDQSC